MLMFSIQDDVIPLELGESMILTKMLIARFLSILQNKFRQTKSVIKADFVKKIIINLYSKQLRLNFKFIYQHVNR